MSHPVITETGYTKFNLSYPAAMANATPTADVYGNGETSTIPGVLFGILVPHIVCTLFILARAYSRLLLLRKWFLDDTLILLAWACSTAVCVIYTISARSQQQPRHHHLTVTATGTVTLTQVVQPPLLSSPTPSSVTPETLRTYTSLILYQLTLLATKLSILTFYHRIFSPPAKSQTPRAAAIPHSTERILVRLTTLATLLYGAPLLALSVLQCHPSPGLFFGRSMAKCFTFEPLLVASTALHTATDAWLIVLIIPCVVRLRDVAPRQRAVLGGVLSLGVFVIAAGVVRLVVSLRGQRDGTEVRSTLAFFVLTVLELDVALICASAPTLRPVLARVWPRWGLGEPFRGPGAGNREGSVDLTSVVSYHGYPWTRNATPVGTPRAGSKNPSVVDVSVGGVLAAGSVPPVPLPPPPAMAMHRTPTTLSLRSFMSSMTPKSRGRLEGEDRTGLLGDENLNQGDDWASRRRSSVGFDMHYEQYMGYDDTERRRSRCGGRAEARLSRGSRCYSARWGDSQESFVLGMNDPHSPKRLSPVSGLSEATKAELRRRGSEDEGV